MAVIWKGTSLAGNGTEPYPNIDITATALRGGDGAYIATDYSIRVTGQMVATGSLVVAGARQNSLFGKINEMALAVDGEDVGKLDIQPYGGGASNMTFPDAKLTSVNFSEAPENSAQVQFQGRLTCSRIMMMRFRGGIQVVITTFFSMKEVKSAYK